LGRGRSTILTMLAIAVPAMGYWAGRGLADITLSMFIFAAAWSLMRWVRDQHLHDAILAGIFTAMAGFTKLEGSVLVVSASVVMTLAMLRKNRQSFWGWIAFILSLGILFGPWLLWSRGLPHTHEDYGSRLTLTNLWNSRGRLPAVLAMFMAEFRAWSFSGDLLFLTAAALIGWRGWRKSFVLAGWFLLGAQVLAYVAAHLVTPWQSQELILSTGSRLPLHVLPLAILLAGLHWGSCKE
jgi:Dolichyl-phosphate-mannose-protein mannosyltransferase